MMNSSVTSILSQEKNPSLLYYLNHLTLAKENISFGIKNLEMLKKFENDLEADMGLSKKDISHVRSRKSYSFSSNQGLFLMESIEKEKTYLANKKTSVLHVLYQELSFVTFIEETIFSLHEPYRTILILRYIRKQSWKEIQATLKKSASNIYELHKQALHYLEGYICHH